VIVLQAAVRGAADPVVRLEGQQPPGDDLLARLLLAPPQHARPDGGPVKEARHMHQGDLTPRPFSVVDIALRQMGLGCIDSWGAWPLEQYLLNEQDYEWSFIIEAAR